jgi:hypothetical protein
MSIGNGEVTLQIAETRFTIKCDYTPFIDWLKKACADFLVTGEPHARLNLSFDASNSNGTSVNNSFNFTLQYDTDGLLMKVKCSNRYEPEKMFREILNAGLHSSVIHKEPPALWLHSSGVIHEGKAYLFMGPSGAGKSTICDILDKEPGFTVLHDEVIALSHTSAGFMAWSSPLRGERPARHCLSAPLHAMFFLNHAQSNQVVRINSKDVPSLISAQIVWLWAKVRDGTLSFNKRTVGLLLDLAIEVPFYQLHFKPDFNFWDCIEQRLIYEPVRKV